MRHNVAPTQFAVWLLTWLWASAAVPASPDSAFSVAYTATGPDKNPDARGILSYFVSRLDARPGFDVTETPGLPVRATWNRPSRMANRLPLSVITVTFGPRTDWLVFLFDDALETVTLAARRPALQRNTAGIYLRTIPPGPDQVDRNAAIELASQFGNAYRDGVASEEAPRLQIEVEAHVVDTAAGGGLPTLEATPATDTGKADFTPGADEVDGFLALAFAAAFENGWRPTQASAESSLHLEVTRNILTYTVKARFADSGSETRLTKSGIKRESVYPYLRHLLTRLRAGAATAYDFAQLDMKPVDLVSMDARRVLVQQEGRLQAHDAFTGAKAWELRPSPTSKVLPAYAPYGTDGGEVRVMRLRPSLASVLVETGAETAFPRGAGGADHDWAFDGNAEGIVVSASERTLTCTSGEVVLWKVTGDLAWTCGPRIHGAMVIAGQRGGAILALSIEDGHTLWRTETKERLRGPLLFQDGLLIASSVEGSLLAYATADGARRWQADLGDGVFGAAWCDGQYLYAASRNRTLSKIALADGHVEKTHAWPVWLTGVRPIPGTRLIACALRDGTVEMLDDAALDTRRRLSLNTRLMEGILASPDFSGEWGTSNEFAPRGPCALVTDKEGFVFVIPADIGVDTP